MQNLTYETLTAIEDMRKAMEKICDLCLDHDEVNDAISGAQYPFEESLDEVAMQVNLWLEEVEGVLNHYDSVNVRDGIFAQEDQGPTPEQMENFWKNFGSFMDGQHESAKDRAKAINQSR